MRKTQWLEVAPGRYKMVGEVGIHQTLGPGIFKVDEDLNPNSGELNLVRIGEKFTFDYKIYDMGKKDYMEHIRKTWESDVFVEGNRNMGVIFNGIKGTGKTVSAKILCNLLDIPVVVIPQNYDGIADFIADIPFECVVLIDEAEKTFTKDTDSCLLKMIDGVMKGARKLFLLTTNELTLNVNLFGRPGRIRYIKEFGNLDPETINEFLNDSLKDQSKRENILSYIDLLEISTIDILRCVVDEVNIHGVLLENSMLNVERARYVFDALTYNEGEYSIDEFKKLVAGINSLTDWGLLVKKPLPEGEEDNDYTNHQDWLLYRKNIDLSRLTSQSSFMFKGLNTNYGTIEIEPDKDGVFIVTGKNYDGTKNETFIKILGTKRSPSLYGNGLVI